MDIQAMGISDLLVQKLFFKTGIEEYNSNCLV